MANVVFLLFRLRTKVCRAFAPAKPCTKTNSIAPAGDRRVLKGSVAKSRSPGRLLILRLARRLRYIPSPSLQSSPLRRSGTPVRAAAVSIGIFVLIRVHSWFANEDE